MAEIDVPLWPDITSPQAYGKITALTAVTAVMLALKKATAKICGRTRRLPALAVTPNAYLIVECQMATATSGNVRLRASFKAVNAAAGESGNPASLTAEAYQNVAVPGTARNRFEVRIPAAGSISEGLASGDRVEVAIERDGTNGADTAAGECEILGATLFADDA